MDRSKDFHFLYCVLASKPIHSIHPHKSIQSIRAEHRHKEEVVSVSEYTDQRYRSSFKIMQHAKCILLMFSISLLEKYYTVNRVTKSRMDNTEYMQDAEISLCWFADRIKIKNCSGLGTNPFNRSRITAPS